MLEKWYFRVLRRWGIVFLCGGIAAVIQALQNTLPKISDPLQLAFLSFLIATLAAADKALRDHNDTPTTQTATTAATASN